MRVGRKRSRRAVLRGMLGGAAVTVGLPLFDRLLNTNGTALADGTELPRRFGVFYWGNGVVPSRWTPPTEGPNWEPSQALASLADISDYINVPTGMRIGTGNPMAHHAGIVGIMSGAPLISQPPRGANYASTYSQKSIDQVVADAVGSETRFRSLEVGVSTSVSFAEGSTYYHLSHNGPDNTNPPEYDAREVFNRIFGGDFRAPATTTPSGVDPRVALRRSVLDAVMADAATLRGRLGKRDQERLDQHLTGIRELEMRLARLEEAPPPPSAGCDVPEPPSADTSLGPRNRAMSDIIAMALACDQTRVFSNMFSGSAGSTRYEGTSTGHHTLTHNEGGDWPQVQRITEFIVGEFGYLLRALKSVPEGPGNLLDSCVVLGTTDCSDGSRHDIGDYPILIGGRGCGYLKYPGVHYRSNRENTSKALLTVLRAAGVQLSEFGYQGGHVTESLGAIET